MHLDFVPRRPPIYLRHHRPLRPSCSARCLGASSRSWIVISSVAVFPRPLAKLRATIPPDRPPIGSLGRLGARVGNTFDSYIHVVLTTLSNTYREL